MNKLEKIIQEINNIKVQGREVIIEEAIFDKYENLQKIKGKFKWSIGEVEFSRVYKYYKNKLKYIVEHFTDFSGTKIQNTYDEFYHKLNDRMIYANSSILRTYDSNGRVIKIEDFFSNGEEKSIKNIMYLNNNKIQILEKNNKTNINSKTILVGNSITDSTTEYVEYYSGNRILSSIKYNKDCTIKTYYKPDGEVNFSIKDYGDHQHYSDSTGYIFKTVEKTKDKFRNIYKFRCYIRDHLAWIRTIDDDLGLITMVMYKDDGLLEVKISRSLDPIKGNTLTKIVNTISSDVLIKSTIYKYVYNGHKYKITEKTTNTDEEKKSISYSFMKSNKQTLKTICTINKTTGEEIISSEVLDIYGNVIKTKDKDTIYEDGSQYEQSYVNNMIVYSEKE